MRIQERNMFASLVIGILFFLSASIVAQNQVDDFAQMQGKLIHHSIIDMEDSLSAQTIVEFRNENGLPGWFARDIYKNVCMTRECRMVRLRIYYNGASNYLGYRLFENDPLTKTDHSVFSPDDYGKLDQILADTLSVLKNLEMKDLLVEKADSFDARVDGHSGATLPSLQEYMVKNAAYTCYTLWHTVYGLTQKEIRHILEQRADSAYLQLIFKQNNPDYLIWAIEFIKKHTEYHSAFYPEIFQLLESKDANLSHCVINYFTPNLLSNEEIQMEFALKLGQLPSQLKYEIVWRFLDIPKVSNDALLIMLQQFDDQKISAGLLGYVCKLIHPENLEDVRIVKELKILTKDKNLYVRNMTQKLLLESSN